MADSVSMAPRRLFPVLGLGAGGLVVGTILLATYILCWVLSPYLSLPGPDKMDLMSRLSGPPSFAHLLGTDHLGGRDVLARIVSAIPVSLGGSAFLAMFVIITIALPWGGLLAGMTGGRVDALMMRIADIIMAFPMLILTLAIIGFMGASLEAAVIGVAVAWWPSVARLVRALVLSAKEKEFVRAAWLGGASHLRIVFFHILPQILPPLALSFLLKPLRCCWRCPG